MPYFKVTVRTAELTRFSDISTELACFYSIKVGKVLLTQVFNFHLFIQKSKHFSCYFKLYISHMCSTDECFVL